MRDDPTAQDERDPLAQLKDCCRALLDSLLMASTRYPRDPDLARLVTDRRQEMAVAGLLRPYAVLVTFNDGRQLTRHLDALSARDAAIRLADWLERESIDPDTIRGMEAVRTA